MLLVKLDLEKKAEKTKMNFSKRLFVVQSKNDQIRRESTAGGAFTEIARYVLKQNGVVFGAAFDDQMSITHQFVEREQDLAKFRGSKYVQSTIGESYIKVKEFLEKGRHVCFSGTPCQIAGLSKFLGKEYEHLILVDVICRATPSPVMWLDYYGTLQKKVNTSIKGIRFRDKFYGYKFSTFSIYTEHPKSDYHCGVESDPWLRAFFDGSSIRPSCTQCAFKGLEKISDFTLWDCFDICRFDNQMDDDKGTTGVLVNSAKGWDIIQRIVPSIIYKELPVGENVGKPQLYQSAQASIKRDSFFELYRESGITKAMEQYYPLDIKARMKRMIRVTLTLLGLYRPMKRIQIMQKNAHKGK